MTSTRLRVHVCAADGTILVTQLHQLVDFSLLDDTNFSDTLDEDSRCAVLPNLEVRLGRLNQISYLLHVDFDHGDLDVELNLERGAQDLVKDVADHTWDHAALLRVHNTRPQHGVRLTTTGLSIGEYRSIETLHDTFHDRFDCLLVYVGLVYLRVEDLVIVELLIAVHASGVDSFDLHSLSTLEVYASRLQSNT